MSAFPQKPTPVAPPPGKFPISSIHIDESGTKNSAAGFFVRGFVKVRNPSALAREIRHHRNRHGFWKEIHFAKISKQSLPFYFDVVETLAAADVRVGASVYSSSSFPPVKATWEQQAEMAAQLVLGNINRGEFINLFLDLINTPVGKSASEIIKNHVNRKLQSHCLIEAYDLDSEATDLIQLADIVASSIAYERKHPEQSGTPKQQVAARLRRALDLDSFDDIKKGKVNILTLTSCPNFSLET